MQIETKYHGTKEYKEEDIIVFERGLPGYEHLRKFILFPVEQNEMFSILHAIDDLEVGMVTVSPFQIMNNYEIDLDDSVVGRLRVHSEEDILLLNTVTLSSKVENITVNLKAPIIINLSEGLGEQIILDSSEYLIKHPLIKG